MTPEPEEKPAGISVMTFCVGLIITTIVSIMFTISIAADALEDHSHPEYVTVQQLEDAEIVKTQFDYDVPGVRIHTLVAGDAFEKKQSSQIGIKTDFQILLEYLGLEMVYTENPTKELRKIIK